jgi:hypothetical protein
LEQNAQKNVRNKGGINYISTIVIKLNSFHLVLRLYIAVEVHYILDNISLTGANSSLRSQQVVWAEQQFTKQRVKRGVVPPLDASDIPKPASRRKRADLEVPSQRIERIFNDELWDQEWYLVSYVHNITASLCFMKIRGE